MGRLHRHDFSGPGTLLEAGASQFPLRPGAVLYIGRSVAADVRIASSGVARIHAAIYLMPGSAERLVVTDLRSTNGTWVRDNAELVAFLSPGEEVLVAGEFRFRFERS